MPTVFDTVAQWARKTTGFAELRAERAGRAESEARAMQAAGDLIYRLRHWPELPPGQKTADIYRTLSVMSHRHVNRNWILASSRLKPPQVDALLQQLVKQGAVEVIDTSFFRNSQDPSSQD